MEHMAAQIRKASIIRFYVIKYETVAAAKHAAAF
jgi:hypothetical protein